MFKIRLSPQDPSGELVTLTLSASGDVLTINGEEFDFSPLLEGETLVNSPVPGNAKTICCDYINSDVVRKDGYIELVLTLPVKWNSPYEARFPSPDVLVIETDGPIALPDTTPAPGAQASLTSALETLAQVLSARQDASVEVTAGGQ